MKILKIFSHFILVLLAVGVASERTLAQSPALGISTLASAGGVCTGGPYAVAGTVGQANAGSFSGGPYMLASGLWPALSNPQPTLRFTANGEFLVLSWPDAFAGFVLQQTTSLSAPAWAGVGQTPTVVNGRKQVTLPVTPSSRFFRLKKP